MCVGPVGHRHRGRPDWPVSRSHVVGYRIQVRASTTVSMDELDYEETEETLILRSDEDEAWIESDAVAALDDWI